VGVVIFIGLVISISIRGSLGPELLTCPEQPCAPQKAECRHAVPGLPRGANFVPKPLSRAPPNQKPKDSTPGVPRFGRKLLPVPPHSPAIPRQNQGPRVLGRIKRPLLLRGRFPGAPLLAGARRRRRRRLSLLKKAAPLTPTERCARQGQCMINRPRGASHETYVKQPTTTTTTWPCSHKLP
jgi:hypothetical protein